MTDDFSFGDYFKQRAIELAWSSLTNLQSVGGYGFGPERLWATVYIDDEAALQGRYRGGLSRIRRRRMQLWLVVSVVVV